MSALLVKILPVVEFGWLDAHRLLVDCVGHGDMRILPHSIHLHIMQLRPLRHLNCHRWLHRRAYRFRMRRSLLHKRVFPHIHRLTTIMQERLLFLNIRRTDLIQRVIHSTAPVKDNLGRNIDYLVKSFRNPYLII